ncbi:hypothetical protein PMZ80_000779 [Knufia obscura]|uniref:Uncharacterized protein n=1 Tax=Knufia obscura TaxID=1635080 RepID=A0ABR0S1C3_9EURO|nr:hypothetical protein PMZ80_000779 [Knufia obscura]
MSAHIYHGPWINWSNGLIGGATVTLGEREGGLLTAFIATFVTIVGAELWKVICYISHQLRSKHAPQDGLYHQQQVILRTSPTPAGAAWLFLLQTWCWAGRARLSLLRTLPWALFGAVYIGAIGLTAIFSSEISKSPGSLRLIVSDNDCGIWSLNMSSPYHQEAYSVKSTNDRYVFVFRFPVPSIPWTADLNATCPFEFGTTCRFGDTAAYKMVSKRINSHYDLGINAPSAGRVELEKTTTCAPLRTAPFVIIRNSTDPLFYGRPDDTVIEYNYGPIGVVTNYTYAYNDHASFDNLGYSLHSVSASAGYDPAGGFTPVPAMNTTDADQSLVFIAANSVTYSEPCGDPIFSANSFYSSNSSGIISEQYYPDYYVSVLGCSEQYRICNPENNKCTDNQGLMQLQGAFTANEGGLDANDMQAAIIQRLLGALQVSTINDATSTRLGAALRASESLDGLRQRYLPTNQWHIEVGSWFDEGLARLQQRTQEYATGPANVPRGSYVLAPNPNITADIPFRAMCYSQLVNDSSDTMSFSVVGMAVLFGVGGLIIFTSLTIDTIVGWLQLKLRKGLHARTEWLISDKLEMQRLLYGEMQLGQWDDSKRLPVTLKKQTFVGVADRHLSGMLKGQGSFEDGADAQLVEEHFDSKA